MTSRNNHRSFFDFLTRELQGKHFTSDDVPLNFYCFQTRIRVGEWESIQTIARLTNGGSVHMGIEEGYSD